MLSCSFTAYIKHTRGAFRSDHSAHIQIWSFSTWSHISCISSNLNVSDSPLKDNMLTWHGSTEVEFLWGRFLVLPVSRKHSLGNNLQDVLFIEHLFFVCSLNTSCPFYVFSHINVIANVNFCSSKLMLPSRTEQSEYKWGFYLSCSVAWLIGLKSCFFFFPKKAETC